MADGVFLAALPSATVHLLKSSQVTRSHNKKESGVLGTRVDNLLLFQVVTSVWSAVKELVENAIDAQATHIEVSVFRKMM